MAPDFEFVQWNFSDTTALLVPLSDAAVKRFGDAVSVNVRISAMPEVVARLEAEGFTVMERAALRRAA